ncbi:CpaE family protein [Kitasatospora sp. NPDC059571]|uniref:AAA family ATPase n=1 Tax=Kitasatospora sp. NPDC059571 TaxID=3346871 RepID=UPI00369AFD85
MTVRILLGVGETEIIRLLRTLLSELGDSHVVESLNTSEGVLDALVALHTDIDVVLLHEELGRTPALQLIREISLRYPNLGIVLLARDGTPETLSAAMEAGARGVLTLPLDLEALDARLHATAGWSKAIRDHIRGARSDVQDSRSGSVIAVAGAKGGVGTTTLATHLALAAADPQRAVCLVDLDLQAGDIGCHFDVAFHRSVVDLADVAEDITGRALEETLYSHESTLRLLLAPSEGERSEEVPARAVRQVISALRSRFDVVVVDAGSTMNQANTAAIEVADQVLLVVTPDVPALRAARRMTQLWYRLQARKDDDPLLVVNRCSRSCDIQPALAGRAVGAPQAATALPASFRELEATLNSGRPHDLRTGSYVRSVNKLAAELGIASRAKAAPSASDRRHSGESRGPRAADRRRRSEAGEEER